jgi:hypothetical protein
MNGRTQGCVCKFQQSRIGSHHAPHVEGLPATSFLLLKNEPEGWTCLQRFLEAMLVEALRWPRLGHESLPPGLIAGSRCTHFRLTSGHAFRCAARMDGGRISEARRYVWKTLGATSTPCECWLGNDSESKKR